MVNLSGAVLLPPAQQYLLPTAVRERPSGLRCSAINNPCAIVAPHDYIPLYVLFLGSALHCQCSVVSHFEINQCSVIVVTSHQY